MLLLLKKRQNSRYLEAQLMSMPLSELRQQLQGEQERKAFWINIYNAYFLLLRQQEWSRPDIFREPLVPIAGQRFSLDEIEHGILRRCRIKWAAGYLPNPFYRLTIRRLMLQRTDYRIHFALNCGARSCPPITFYQASRVEEQLDLATHSFLEQETTIDESGRTLYTTRLLRWYIGDFGGLNGVRKLLARTLQLEDRNWRIRFRPYDWREALYRFS